MFRTALTATTAIVAAALASPASAAIYNYNMSNGAVMTINTATASGSMIGSGIDATFSGAGLASFAGGFNLPSFMTNISIDPSSTRVVGGVTYSPNTNHQQMLETGAAAGGSNVVNLWSYWGLPACPSCSNLLGDYLVTAVSSSSGGTAVPEPGMIGLFGLGAAGLLVSRRRATKVRATMRFAAA